MENNSRTTVPVYLLPSIRKGNGLGHLLRCAWISEKMENGQLLLYKPGKGENYSLKEIQSVLEGREAYKKIITAFPDTVDTEDRKGDFPILVLDQRQTSPEIFYDFAEKALLFGLDEGGCSRDRVLYLADTLPGPETLSPANIASPLLLPGPSAKRETPEKIQSILITFGGEDPGHLTEISARLLLEELAENEALDITICLGPLFLFREFKYRNIFPDFKYLRAPENLKEQLHRYDLVITSFGLTAFEAVRAGVPVLLKNPSDYHDSLGRNSGFQKFNPTSFKHTITNPSLINRGIKVLSPGENLGLDSASVLPRHPELPELLSSLHLKLPACPACGAGLKIPEGGIEVDNTELVLLERFPERTYYECANCSLVFQNLYYPPKDDYGEDYFFEDYKKQYGKTYLEDFPNLRKMAAERLSIIEKLTKGTGRPRIREGASGRTSKPGHGKDLLEIGCAYGPFLQEASSRGFYPRGIDVAAGAVAWVKKELGLEAAVVPMEELDLWKSFGIKKADVVALWYVIEHFPELGNVMEKIAAIQEPGGILAFSTPNYRGISGRKNRRSFLLSSPLDHYHIWSPGIARKVLKLYGYRIRKIRVTGHHPERFPGYGGTRGPFYHFFMFVSRLFDLGDTFEVYAEKIKPGEAE